MSWFSRQSATIKASITFFGGLVVLLIGVALFVPKSDDTPTPAAAEPTANSDPTMGPRTRAFVGNLRDCQTSVRILRGMLSTVSDSTDRVTLSTRTAQVKDICSSADDVMTSADKAHFFDQALDAEVAIDEYEKALDAISDYIDTSTPSDIPNATTHFANADSAAAQAIQEINERRQLYGFGNL